jgi:ubiquinone/menaquinone biosynthesis C-methylase UbiE
MAEVNLLKNYPHTQRNLTDRQARKSAEDIRIARQFAREYFDGDRRHGYGGYQYHPRFWRLVVPDFQRQYGLTAGSRVLDVGCAKGFMLYDFTRLIPGISVTGVDLSRYAIDNALEEVRPFLQRADARKLPFSDQSFDLVISINTIHNLPPEECKQALREIQRVTKKHAFLTVDAYRNDEEKERMTMWNLTALTYMHVEEWAALFQEVGYQGDYYWFIP